MNRRIFITSSARASLALALPGLLSACEKEPFVRPAQLFKLGKSSEFLYKKVFVRDKKFLIHRLKGGWAALSTRCTHLGCDLTYQERNLYCACCGSVYSHFGKVLRGPAKVSLPWVEMSHKDDTFFADTEKIVPASTRFTTQEIEKIIKDYGFEFKEVDDINESNVKVPELLQPKGEIEIPMDELDEPEIFIEEVEEIE